MDVSDDRGQALQVGAILLFGILIVGLALYQATVVPTQNERVEFESYLDANSDMEQLGSEIGAAAARDYSTRTAVTTGVNYPSRTVFVNPGPPGNRLRTGDTDTVRIENATAVSGEEPNTRFKWNGTTQEYETTSVRFDSNYNQLQAPPIVYESGVIYRPPGETVADESVVVSDGDVVENDRITIVTLAGDLDAGGLQPTVVARPVSAHTRSVVVTGNGSENITLTLPSELSNETWESEVLDEEIDDGSVLSVQQNGTETVDVVLNGSRTFELRLAKVELRRQDDSGTVNSTAPEYVVGVAGDRQTVSADKSAKLTAEVRDRYNNPKRGVNVTFTADNGTFAESGGATRTVRTDSEGRATVQFEPGDVGELEVNASIAGGGSDALNTTTFTVNVNSASGLGGKSDPATASGDAAGAVVLQSDVSANSDQNNVTYTFSLANGVDQQVNVTGFRLVYANLYKQSAGGPGGGGNEFIDGPENVTDTYLQETGGPTVATSSKDAGEGREPVFYDANFTLDPATSSYEYTLKLDGFDIANKDTLIISITIYFEGGLSGEYPAYIFG